MDDFQNAFNDADVVFVAPVYPAGEEPIEGVDAAALAEGLRARGHRMVKTVDSAADLAANLRDLAAEGDIVICMGAGDITKWAAGLADGIAQGKEVEVSTAATIPTVRGKLKADAPLAPLVWFKSGGNADWLFEPADPDDLVQFLKGSIRDTPVMALGLGSNMIVRDGGVPGVTVRLGKAFSKIERVDEVTLEMRRRSERDPRFLDRARCGDCGAGIPARNSRHGRRLRSDERRRLWPRSADILISCTVVLKDGTVEEWPAERLGYTYRHSELPEGAVVVEAVFRGIAGRSADHRPGDGPHRRRARGIAAVAQPHRRLDLQEPAGAQGLGAGRCGGLPRPARRRRASVGEALQFPAQSR